MSLFLLVKRYTASRRPSGLRKTIAIQLLGSQNDMATIRLQVKYIQYGEWAAASDGHQLEVGGQAVLGRQIQDNSLAHRTTWLRSDFIRLREQKQGLNNHWIEALYHWIEALYHWIEAL